MSISDDLSSQFKVLNAPIAPRILQRCEELCLTYSISPGDFVDQWLAYAASNSHPLAPTINALDRMERNELKKQTQQTSTDTPVPVPVQIETTPVRTPLRQNPQNEMTQSSQMLENTPHHAALASFSSRKDSGDVVQSFGESTNFTERCSKNLVVKIHNSGVKTTYMNEKFLTKRECLENVSAWIVGDICTRSNLKPSTERLTDYVGEMTICGRICSQTQGKLDEKSIFCEGLLEPYRGQRIKLNLSQIQNVRLFPGQSAVLTGSNTKDFFTVTGVSTVTSLPPSQPPTIDQTIQIIVATGPFTLPENLRYEPLEPILAHAIETKPNLLCLMGPFLDKTHAHLDDIWESYDSFFDTVISSIMNRLPGNVNVVLIPSHKDVHNHVVFPSPAYTTKKLYNNLFLAPNPFILDIGGVVIAGSTADVLFHLGKVEFAKGAFQDRIGQLARHIFNQRSLYPLYPPNSELRVDYQLMEEFAVLETTPHVMILPSNFRHFVKVVEDCVVVNPERITKGSGGGTFAQIEVRAGPKDRKVCERVSCCIVRV